MMGIRKTNVRLKPFGNLLHVLAVLALMVAGGNYVHAVEPAHAHEQVTYPSSADETTTHQHLASYDFMTGISTADMLHCGSDILALVPEFAYIMRVTGSKLSVETLRTNRFLLPTPELPPPRILI